MAFEWHRTHKILDWVEREMTECVEEYVTEYYGIESVEELTDEQLAELDHFRNEELNDNHPLQMGFSNVIVHVENLIWEREQENETDQSDE